MVEAGGVVDQALVLVGGQHVAGARLQKMNSALVHSKPEILGPVGGEGLLKLAQIIEATSNKFKYSHSRQIELPCAEASTGLS